MTTCQYKIYYCSITRVSIDPHGIATTVYKIYTDHLARFIAFIRVSLLDYDWRGNHTTVMNNEPAFYVQDSLLKWETMNLIGVAKIGHKIVQSEGKTDSFQITFPLAI